ncbi:cytochrome P450 [Streptomyces sp. NPDC001219]
MSDYDPLSPVMVENPYPAYAQLRATEPVFWSERLDSWVLTRYRDCRAVLSDAHTFASDRRRAGFERPTASSMQNLDPPEHTPLRRLFTTTFREQDLDGIGDAVVADTRELVAKYADAPEFDFTADVARPVALFAVCRLLGVDPPPVARFAALSDALVRGMDAGLRPEVREPALAAREKVSDLISGWYHATRRPGLLSQVLAGAERAGVREPEIWNSARVLFLAGYSTTVGAAANAVHTLLTHPGTVERMRDPQLLASGVDELLRFDGPVQGTSRTCVERTGLGGVTIERGELVLMLFGAANRDPEQFASPDDLVLDRSPNRHLSFGWGPHACTGATLARIVVRALVTGLLTGPRPPRPAGPPWRERRATLRYPDRLPLTFRPERP